MRGCSGEKSKRSFVDFQRIRLAKRGLSRPILAARYGTIMASDVILQWAPNLNFRFSARDDATEFNFSLTL
jgi:hypothetical protein